MHSRRPHPAQQGTPRGRTYGPASPTNLRALLRRYRDGVDGARLALVVLLEDHRGDLRLATGLRAHELPLPTAPGAADRLAELIEHAFSAASRRTEESRANAIELHARRLVDGSVVTREGVRLCCDAFRDLVSVPGKHQFAFRVAGRELVVERLLLASVVRETSGVRVIDLRIDSGASRLSLDYETPLGGGRLSFHLQSPDRGEDYVAIDFESRRAEQSEIDRALTRSPTAADASLSFASVARGVV